LQHLAYGERYMFRMVFAGQDLEVDDASDGAVSDTELGEVATAGRYRPSTHGRLR
jgi:hypothetical protein